MRGARCQALLLPVQAVIAGCALVKNAALHRALRRKDNEMNQLILMVRPMHLCCDTSGTLAELCFPITSLAAGPSSCTEVQTNSACREQGMSKIRNQQCCCFCAGVQPAGEPAGCGAVFARSHRAPRVRSVILPATGPHPAGQHCLI